MNQILAAIKLIGKLGPLILETVAGLQVLFPGKGAAKMGGLVAVVEQAAAAEPVLADLYKQAAGKLIPILNIFVALFKGKQVPPTPAP